MASTPSALSVTDLTVSYDREPVLEHVSFEVEAGRLVGVVGPNGAGKSTMIKAIVGALPADAGQIRVLGTTGRSLCSLVRPLGVRLGAMRALGWCTAVGARLVVSLRSGLRPDHWALLVGRC